MKFGALLLLKWNSMFWDIFNCLILDLFMSIFKRFVSLLPLGMLFFYLYKLFRVQVYPILIFPMIVVIKSLIWFNPIVSAWRGHEWWLHVSYAKSNELGRSSWCRAGPGFPLRHFWCFTHAKEASCEVILWPKHQHHWKGARDTTISSSSRLPQC